jgi:Na+-transporting NADH:ubiquinone oxidoreductase subunit D
MTDSSGSDSQKSRKKCGRECRKIMREGIHTNNPVTCQVLGICSCLAVTNRLESALVMGAALIFVLVMSNLIVSLLRNMLPRRIRMIAEVAIIATFVILFDQFLKAFYWEMSKQLGPDVGLIITNCIVMGRAEAFASKNTPRMAIVDGVANGIGYTVFLALIAIFRELVGSGTIAAFGITLPSLTAIGYETNILFVLAPGAFLAAGFLIWIINAISIAAAKSGEESE